MLDKDVVRRNMKETLTLTLRDCWRVSHGRCSTKYTGKVMTSHTNVRALIAPIAVWIQKLSILQENKQENTTVSTDCTTSTDHFIKNKINVLNKTIHFDSLIKTISHIHVFKFSSVRV